MQAFWKQYGCCLNDTYLGQHLRTLSPAELIKLSELELRFIVRKSRESFQFNRQNLNIQNKHLPISQLNFNDTIFAFDVFEFLIVSRLICFAKKRA